MTTTQVHIKQEFFRFAENISVKGVSRILKANNRIYRVLWSIAVITSLCILLWQLLIVLIRYFTWPVDTLIEESSEQPPFPDVTICNLEPTYSIESMSERISWLSYGSVLREAIEINTFQEFHRVTGFSEEDYKDLLAYLHSRTAYFSNFPIIVGNITFDDHLIKTCQVYDWQWRENKSKTCEPIYKYHWDPNYYACRTLSVPDECQGKIRGISFILYIHNFPEMLQLAYHPSIVASLATGVLVAIHTPGTLPNLKMANSVGPGTQNNIRLSPVIRSRLPSPYSDCTNQKYIQSQTDITDKKLLYTKDVCIDVCFQQQVLDQCGCLSNAFQFTPEQRYHASGMVCGNLSLLENTSLSTITKGMKDYLCSVTAPVNSNICEDGCKNNCEEVSNGLTTSSAPWPQLSTQLVFAKAMNVFHSSYGSQFDIYKNILKEFYSNKNSSETIRQLEKVDLIEKNFLQLNIYFEGYSALKLKDVPSLTSDKMLGIIGGSLSLWLGISIMTLVEVVEFICTLVHMYVQKKKVVDSSAVQSDLPVAAVGKSSEVNRTSYI